MRRGVPLQNLRGSDITTLEIQIQDLVNKPLGQVATANIADLCALSELADLPGRISRKLEGYPRKVGREVSDLPSSLLDGFLADLEGLAPARVPSTLREVFVAEAERTSRNNNERERIGKLQEGWLENAPEPFRIAAPPPRPVVQRASAAPPRESSARRASGGADRTARAAPTPRPKVVMDERKVAWIRDTVLDRLADAFEGGLAESVLIAGVRHRARDMWPDMQGHEVKSVLNDLASMGRARQSAGRWRLSP